MLVATALAGAGAAGETLAPGGLVYGFEGTTQVEATQLRGKVVEDATAPFRYQGWIADATSGRTVVGEVTGSVESRVVRNRDGSYDFYWRISVDRDAFLPVARLTLAGLPPQSYDANWRRDSAGDVTPAYVEEAPTGQVDWHFGQYLPPSTEIYPGRRTYLIFLASGATHYTRDAFLSLLSERDSGGSAFLDWGGSSGLYPTFGPASGEDSGSVRHAAPAALASALTRSDPALRSLPGRTQGCIVSHIAAQQARYATYGPRGGPYDQAAVHAAAISFASACR